MKKSFVRTLGLTLMLAALVATPLKSFADDGGDPIVSGGDPTPTINAQMSLLTLALSLATQ